MSGKRYPEEFKTEAVKQVVDRGYPHWRNSIHHANGAKPLF